MNSIEIRTKNKRLLVGYLASCKNEPLLLIRSRGKEDVIALKEIYDAAEKICKTVSINKNIYATDTK